MNISKIAIACTTLSILLAGCGTTSSSLRPNFGQAVETAYDKQVVSSEAVAGAPEMHPEMVAAAIQRYLDDQVKKPEEVETIEIE